MEKSQSHTLSESDIAWITSVFERGPKEDDIQRLREIFPSGISPENKSTLRGIIRNVYPGGPEAFERAWAMIGNFNYWPPTLSESHGQHKAASDSIHREYTVFEGQDNVLGDAND